MHDDEEQLVVMVRRGLRMLQGQQLRHFQIRTVSQPVVVMSSVGVCSRPHYRLPCRLFRSGRFDHSIETEKRAGVPAEQFGFIRGEEMTFSDELPDRTLT